MNITRKSIGIGRPRNPRGIKRGGGCLFELPPLVVLGLLAGLGIALGFVYYQVNWDWWGLAGPDFSKLQISRAYDEFRNETYLWKIQYEKTSPSRFAGLIRYIGPIREDEFEILTHDILVTSGDYADPERVDTSVSNHHFRWQSKVPSHLQGEIHLLHVVPANAEIYRQLLRLRQGEWVVFSGREILSIDLYNHEAQKLGFWTDTGCNTLVVTGVDRLPPEGRP